MNTGRFITTALAASILAIPAMAEAPGYFKVPGTDTTMKIYGYAVLDAAYDIKGQLGDFGGILQAKADGKQPDNQWTMTANRSRFGITTTTPSSLGDVTTKIEGDFLAGQFRLRHGYMQLGGFLAGKTWSNFWDGDASADTVDFSGPIGGQNFDTARFAQLRYTFDLSKQASLALSFEQDSTDSTNHGFPGAIVGAFNWADSWGHVRVAAVSQRYKYEKTGATYAFANDGTDLDTGSATAPTWVQTAAAHKEASKSVFGWTVSGNFNIGKDNLIASVVGGDGLGSYSAAKQQGVVRQADDSLKAQKSMGYMLGYTHVWSDSVRSNIVLTELKFKKDTDTGLVGDAFEKVDEIFLNTFFSPTKTTEFGVEYVYGKATTFDKDTLTKGDGTLTDNVVESRIQLAFKATLF